MYLKKASLTESSLRDVRAQLEELERAQPPSPSIAGGVAARSRGFAEDRHVRAGKERGGRPG